VPNERLIIHGEGFNFLTFASSLHADWTIGGREREIVSFFFKSSGHYAATPCDRSYQRLVTSVSACRKINSNRPPPDAAVFLENGRSETIQIVSFLDSFVLEVLMRPVAPLIVAICLLVAAAEPPATRKNAQSSSEPNSRPGTGQKYLEKLVGNWDVSKVFYPREGDPVRSRGECRQTLIQDGKFLQSEFVFQQDGGKSTGQGVIGFEPDSGRFTSFWIDSRQTKMSARQSREPFDGMKIVLYSLALDPQAKESPHSKTISQLEDHDAS
jgi:hypothetical protein